MLGLGAACQGCAALQMIHSGTHGEVATQVLVSLPLAYMAAACYYSLFKLGIFSFYHMVPHATSPRSLLMNAAQARCLTLETPVLPSLARGLVNNFEIASKG